MMVYEVMILTMMVLMITGGVGGGEDDNLADKGADDLRGGEYAPLGNGGVPSVGGDVLAGGGRACGFATVSFRDPAGWW